MNKTTPQANDLAKIKLLICDVDGVLTDGTSLFDANGVCGMSFSIVDGLGLILLQEAGIHVAVMTTSDNPIIAARVKRLRIQHYFPRVFDKGVFLPELCEKVGVKPEEAAYISDDINDCEALVQVGMPVAVANARKEVVERCKWQTQLGGGHGAVREICDALLAARGLDPIQLWKEASS